MDVLYIKILLYIIVISKYLPVLLKDERQRWIEYCHNDYTKCPNCFVGNNTLSGETFLENIRIESRFDLEVSSLFGNRKIQYGTSGQQKVILKYLIDDESFDALTSKCCDGRVDCKDFWTKKSNSEMLRTELLRNFQTKDSVAGFQICPSDSVPRFMEVFSQQNVYEWLLLNLNVEPLIIDRLKRSNFPVPKLYGLCGFVTLQSNNGLPLYSFFDQSFSVRLLIAKNLLNAALKFSFGLEGFRIYLTDATPDNIVVDAVTFDVTFVDLDNVFLVDSETFRHNRMIHRHEKIACDGMCFAYVPDELCSYHLSDINLFSICQMFVNDPNRMPSEGLLHSVPDKVTNDYPDLQLVIHECLSGRDDSDRFVTVQSLLEVFNKILLN